MQRRQGSPCHLCYSLLGLDPVQSSSGTLRVQKLSHGSGPTRPLRAPSALAQSRALA